MGVYLTAECDDCGTQHEVPVMEYSRMVGQMLPDGWQGHTDDNCVYPKSFCPDCKVNN